MPRHSSLFIIILLSSLSSLLNAQPCKEVVGYYCNWQWYDRSKLVNPMTIDYSKYTIINYAFFNPQTDGSLALTDSWADDNLLLGPMNWSLGVHDSTQSLSYQAHAHGVKVLASLGGWTLSTNFPQIAADPAKRTTFASECIRLINTYHFDGIDIDWEYPGYVDHGGTPADRNNYVLLLQEVRNSLNALQSREGENYLLTAALPAGPSNMVNIDWTALSSLLDIMNIMTYDFFGSWDNNANHNAPLYAPQFGDPAFNCDAAIQTILNQYNVPSSKVNMGIPFYGRSVKTIGTPLLFCDIVHQADNVTFFDDDGSPLYYNILAKMNLFTSMFDNQAKVPYLLGNSTLNTFVSYDDSISVTQKAQYIVNNNLRGAIVWEISGDVLETSPGSGIIAGTPLASALNNGLCLPTSIQSGSVADEISIFPNPVNGKLNIRMQSNSSSVIRINDSLGKNIVTTKMDEASVTVDLSSLSSGVYTVYIQSENRTINKKLVVQH